MFSYIALSWNSADPAQAALAARMSAHLGEMSPRWLTALVAPGLEVCCRRARFGEKRVHVLADGSGVIVGTLFRVSRSANADPRERDLIDADASARIIATGGRQLIRDYWGNYIAFLRDNDRDRAWVLRAPAGALPCFHAAHRGINIYFSSVEDCMALGAGVSINREYVATN